MLTEFVSILFINAEESYHKERKQNIIGEAHSQKICESFHRWTAITDFSRIVPVEDLQGEASLSVRQYIDVTPPSLTQDVTAHIEGGIPTTEIERNRQFLQNQGFEIDRIFQEEVV